MKQEPTRGMRRTAVVNQKGGSGKTTTTISLAAVLAETGKRVLVVDVDPQANATGWLGQKNLRRDLLEVFTEERDLCSIIVPTNTDGVDLVPASEWLTSAERGVAGEIGAEMILRKALDGLPPRWDYVFLDCQPSLGFLVISALAATHEVLVAVEASSLALTGLASIMPNLDRVRERLNPGIRLAGILACRVDGRQRHDLDAVDLMRKQFAEKVFTRVIRANCSLKEAHSHEKVITAYSPRSIGAQDYRAVAAEFVKRGSPKPLAEQSTATGLDGQTVAADSPTRRRKGAKSQQQPQGDR